MIDVDKFPQVGQRFDKMKSEKRKYVDLYQQALTQSIALFFSLIKFKKLMKHPMPIAQLPIKDLSVNYLANSISK